MREEFNFILETVRRASLNGSELKVLVLLLEKNKTIEELEKDIWLTRRTIKRILKFLEKYNFIFKSNDKPIVYWINRNKWN
jgi:DNA-binding MarR family transcriptional regulator